MNSTTYDTNNMENQAVNSTPIKKAVWPQLFKIIYLPSKKLFHEVIILAVLTAIFEGSFILITKMIVDDIVALGAETNFIGYGVLYFLMVTGLCLCIRQFILTTGLLSNTLMYILRKQSFEHLQDLSFSFYDKHAVGWLVSRVTSDCARISRLLAWGTLDLAWGASFVLGLFGVLFYLNAYLALMILAVFPVLFVVTVYFRDKILESSRLVRRTNSKLTAVYNEGISGVQTSKILVREADNLEDFKVDSQQMFLLSRNNLLLSSAFFPMVTIIVSVGTGIALWEGGAMVIGGALTIGSLIAFINASQTLMDPLLQSANAITEFQRTTACAERVLGLINVEPDIKDSEQVKANPDVNDNAANKKIESIEFKDTSFYYNVEEPVLSNFSLEIKTGQTVALVGATGSGKSTIVNLLCRFYEPTSGEIKLNGLDYRQHSLAWLQSKLGIVLQTPFLFSGSIESNIGYGNLNASSEDIIAAAKSVNVHDLIMSLPEGYQTQVQEGGDNFSTGQKQLISFARAILADPEILVMDEATSSVDTHTEHLLQRGLNTILQNRTSFVIAHRLSTIRNADLILVIDGGKLIEKGSHAELLALKGHYFDLYQKQFETKAEMIA